MMRRYCRGGMLCRPSALLAWTVFFAASIITPVISQTFDFVVIEKPRYLTVYDVFQQSLSSQQLALIQPFVPMRILNARDILSDGFTNCMKVDVDGDIFFLLSNNNGKLEGWNKLGAIRIYKHKTILQDTIKILVSRKIIFEKFADGSRTYLTTGDRCVRYFEDGGSVCVKRIGKEPEFGWINIPNAGEGSLWKNIHIAEVQSDISSSLHERIYGRVQQVNQTLVQIYAMLNRESGKQLKAPQWNADSQAEWLSFILIPESAINTYPKSTELLKTSLQTYLLGTGYNVSITGNRVDIKLR